MGSNAKLESSEHRIGGAGLPALTEPATVPFLVVATETRLCAIPLECVREAMRPLPIEPVGSGPPCLYGVSLIRGATVPVVSLDALLTPGAIPRHFGRFALLAFDSRYVALAVTNVVGVRRLSTEDVRGLPPLLSDGAIDSVSALGILDSKLLLILRRSRVVPDEVWAAVAKDTQ
jgi:purine-binding chemotaxis protein CheW